MVTELRSFLGFTNYYRQFIKGNAEATHPPHDQIYYNKRKIQWTDECPEAFDMLKDLCTSAPVVAFADFT